MARSLCVPFCRHRRKYCRKGRNQDSKNHRNQQVEPGSALCCSSELVVDELSENHSLSGGYFFLGNKKKQNLILPQTGPKARAFKIFHEHSASCKKPIKCQVPRRFCAFFSVFIIRPDIFPPPLHSVCICKLFLGLETHKIADPANSQGHL